MKNIFTYILLICFITIGFTAKAQQQANFFFLSLTWVLLTLPLQAHRDSFWPSV